MSIAADPTIEVEDGLFCVRDPSGLFDVTWPVETIERLLADYRNRERPESRATRYLAAIANGATHEAALKFADEGGSE